MGTRFCAFSWWGLGSATLLTGGLACDSPSAVGESTTAMGGQTGEGGGSDIVCYAEYRLGEATARQRARCVGAALDSSTATSLFNCSCDVLACEERGASTGCEVTRSDASCDGALFAECGLHAVGSGVCPAPRVWVCSPQEGERTRCECVNAANQ
ncbi:MAG: hypothetical protein RL385_4010 [Pseudomonadota bacterium]|jgi:hypothetical protein